MAHLRIKGRLMRYYFRFHHYDSRCPHLVTYDPTQVLLENLQTDSDFVALQIA